MKKITTNANGGEWAKETIVQDAPLSPTLMRYREFHQKYPGYVLFFRAGEFYEMFHDDAELAAGTLGITITLRGDVKVAAVAYHSVEVSLRRMIAAGYKCAICDQATPDYIA